MGIVLSLFFGIVPMLFFAWFVYWLDRYEKEPSVLLGVVFVWGAIIAAGAAFLLNSILGVGVYLFTHSEVATDLTTGSLIAPVVEESLKGLAVLLIFLLFRKEFDTVLDGIIYAAIVALGFAATENALYIYRYGYAESGLSGVLAMTFVRVILVGWQHPFYTAFTGIGLAISRLNKNPAIKLAAPVGGWLMAVFTHSLHNTLASLASGVQGLLFGTIFDWIGWFIMFLFIIWVTGRERGWIRNQLQEEVSLGLITPEQYQIACSAWAQNNASFQAFVKGRYRMTKRFYQTCAELAFKKKQLALIGEEGENSQIIQRLRQELGHLSSQI
jgi:RsiW-degrading membrane proteinase PrsW (M82 family)